MIERIFKAYDIRATYPDMINEDCAWKVGYATALYAQRSRQSGFGPKVRMEKTIVVGRDMRAHSPALQAALMDGIRSAGFDAIDIGMVDTPLIYFAINNMDCVAGIQVTGSHLPATYAGFKISGPKARPIGVATGLEDIRRITSTLRVGKTGLNGSLQQADLWSAYRRHVLRFLNLRRKIRVAVDGSNGMAGWMIPAVFDKIPQLEILPILFDTNGTFLHQPNPMVDANLNQLREKVTGEKVELGACFDGDADSCLFIDENGNAIRGDYMAALLARDALSEPAGKGATVIYDLRCSHVVPEEITAASGKPQRDRVGPSSIKKNMAETNAIFAGELSGHYYFRENFNCESGAIAFARLLSMLSGQMMPFSEMVKPLKRYTQSGELSFVADDRDAKLRDLADRFRKLKVDYLDGATFDGGDWWFNVRKSNAEPLLRLNLECRDAKELAERLAEVKAVLGEPVQ